MDEVQSLHTDSTSKIPVMIVHGSTDIQVKEEEGKRLSACKPGAKFVL